MFKKLISILVIFSVVIPLSVFCVKSQGASDFNEDEYLKKNQIWDVDFEGSTIYYQSSTSSAIADSEKNMIYNKSGDYIGGNTGSANSSISIGQNTKATNRSNGDSVCMKSANSTDLVQFNNLLSSTVGESVVVYELDVCVSDFNTQRAFHPQYYTNDGNSKLWAKNVLLGTSGKFSFGGNTTDASIDTWHTIKIVMDIPNSREICYIDGNYLGEETIDASDYYGMFKLSINFRGAQSEMWLDNFNIYELASQSDVLIEKDVLWDFDFEDETTRTNKATTVLCDANGTTLKNQKGDSVSMNTGSEESSIYIEEISDTSNKALCLSAGNSTDLVQTNNFFCTVTEELFVFEGRAMAPDFNTNKVMFWLVYEDDTYTQRWSSNLYMKKASSDTSYFMAGETQIMPCKTNVWYNYQVIFDITSDTLRFYIEDELVFTERLLYNAVKSVRVSLRNSAGAEGKVYFDDIKVYQATKKPFSRMNIYIDGNEATRISKGKLGVSVEFSPWYTYTTCMICVYDADKLQAIKRIESIPTSYEAPQTVYEEYLCDVDVTHSVKVLFFDEGTLRPRDKYIYANKNGVSTQMLNTKDCSTIFESENAVKKLLLGMVCYHPGSGLVTIDNEKTPTEYKGEYTDDVLMVPAKLFEMIPDISASVSQNGKSIQINGCTISDGASTANGIALSKAPYMKNNLLYVPLADIVQSVLGKSFYATTEGINSGAVVISNSQFAPGSVSVQTLNDYILYERPTKEKVLSDFEASPMKGVHPRVIMTGEDFERVKNATDAKTLSQKSKLITNANSILNENILIYELRDGVRLWYVSMDFMDRMMTLAFAYKLTGNKAYFDRAVAEMDSIASFPDWHPEHHIDVGGLGVGFAIGYDWLYHDLSEEKRAQYEAAVYDLCYSEYYKGFTGTSSDMKSGIVAGNNHNSVMNSGITMCAVAFMDVYPDLGAYFISNALRATEITIKNFYPDGSWYEGVGYGCMTLEYLSLQLSSMEPLFGTLYGIDCAEGMSDSSDYILNLQCPTGAFSFYDGGSNGFQWHSGTLWFAEHFGKDYVSAYWRDNVSVGETKRSLVSSLMYFNPSAEGDVSDAPKDVFYEENDIIILRDSWSDSSPTFVGAKGGKPGDPHGHMDVGTFAFYSDGVRWTTDYGAESYNLPGFWDSTKRDGQRWDYFSLRGEAHNCLIIDPDEHGEYEPSVHSEFVRYESSEEGVIAVLDMTDSHFGKANSAKRGFFFADNRQSLVVRDELELSDASDVYWFLQTEHTVTIDGTRAVITDKQDSSKQLIIDFVSNCDFTLEASMPEPLPTSPSPSGLKSMAGKTRIMLKINASGNVNITAKLTPSSVAGSDIESYNTSVSNWEIN